jgi:hypothetical protein
MLTVINAESEQALCNPLTLPFIHGSEDLPGQKSGNQHVSHYNNYFIVGSMKI